VGFRGRGVLGSGDARGGEVGAECPRRERRPCCLCRHAASRPVLDSQPRALTGPNESPPVGAGKAGRGGVRGPATDGRPLLSAPQALRGDSRLPRSARRSPDSNRGGLGTATVQSAAPASPVASQRHGIEKADSRAPSQRSENRAGQDFVVGCRCGGLPVRRVGAWLGHRPNHRS
jgi:hypothetical protein